MILKSTLKAIVTYYKYIKEQKYFYNVKHRDAISQCISFSLEAEIVRAIQNAVNTRKMIIINNKNLRYYRELDFALLRNEYRTYLRFFKIDMLG